MYNCLSLRCSHTESIGEGEELDHDLEHSITEHNFIENYTSQVTQRMRKGINACMLYLSPVGYFGHLQE